MAGIQAVQIRGESLTDIIQWNPSTNVLYSIVQHSYSIQNYPRNEDTSFNHDQDTISKGVYIKRHNNRCNEYVLEGRGDFQEDPH